MFCNHNNIIIVIDNEVTEHELDISLDGCQSLWMELTVTESKTHKKRNMNAAVTVQKSAHRILLYSLRGAEQELPLFITDQRDFSPLLRGSPSACPPGQSGPANRLAFTESTT